MKALKATLLPLLSVGCGGLALSLRLILNGSRDELGLLPNSHICAILTYVLAAAFLVVLFLCTRGLAPISSYKALFPASQVRATGCALAAIGVLYAGFSNLGEGGWISVIALLLGILSALAMASLSMARLAGATPNSWFQMVPVLYLMVHAILQVRQWSATVQISSYVFPLFAAIFLMLAAYYHASLNIRRKGRRWFVFSSQAALFFCMMSMGGQSRVFYISMAAWTLLDSLPGKE